VGLVVIVWPSLGALALRERWHSAVALAIAVALAAIVVWTPIALAAFVAGAFTFIFATMNPARVSRLLAGAFAAVFLVAPALPLLLAAVLPARAANGLLAPMLVWADIIRGEGLRLVTGHGIDMATRGVAAGFLPAGTPHGILFQVWYELGVVGACTWAVLVARAFLAAGRTPGAIAPFLLAGLVCGLALAISGLSTAQSWWVAQVAVVAIAFAAVAKGQYRTVRPVAHVVSGAPPPPAV
jgi:hypothetical protein